MTGSARRRRAVLLLSLALAAGGLAASEVQSRVDSVEARTGAPVPVVVAREDMAAGEPVDPARLELRDVPGRFVPPDVLTDTTQAAGRRLSAPLPRGAYLTEGAFATEPPDEEAPGPALRRGERAVEIAVAGTGGPAGGAEPGARVDVLVTTEGRSGGGRTYVALENVELLDLREGAGEASDAAADAGGPVAAALATLRVTPTQAVFLTAADSFARELRLLVRPPGDRRPLRSPVVASGEL